MEQTFKARNPQLGVWLFAIGNSMHCDQFHNYTSNLDRYRMYRSQCNHLFFTNILQIHCQEKRRFTNSKWLLPPKTNIQSYHWCYVYSPCLGHAENKDQTRHRVCHDRSPITPGTDKSPAKDESWCKSKELYLRQDSQRKNQSPI